jgi:hypothetical protein
MDEIQIQVNVNMAIADQVIRCLSLQQPGHTTRTQEAFTKWFDTIKGLVVPVATGSDGKE